MSRSVSKSVAIAMVATVAFGNVASAQGVPSFRDERRLPPQALPTPAPIDPEIEARRRAEIDAHRARAEEQKRLADLEVRRTRDEAERRVAEENARRAAAAEAQRRTEIEAEERAARAARRAEELAETRRRGDAEAQRLAADTQHRLAEEARRSAEQDAKRQANDEAARRAAVEVRRKVEDDERRRLDLEAKRRDEDEARRRAEAEARARVEQEARRRAEADALKQQDIERQQGLAVVAQRLADDAAARAAAILAAKAAEDDQSRAAARAFAGKTDHTRLIERAQRFLAQGDMASARLLLERAADAGSADAARDLVTTYDTAALVRQGLAVSDADPVQAARWARRAADLRAQAEVETKRLAAASAAAARRSDEPAASVAPVVRSTEPVPNVGSVPPFPASAAVVQTVPTPAAPSATAASIDRSGDGPRLLARGRVYLQRGDLVSARLLFERAADAGNADGARELSRTYDAARLDRSGLPLASADAALVERWSRRAAELQAVIDVQRLAEQSRTTTAGVLPSSAEQERLSATHQSGTTRAPSTGALAALPTTQSRDGGPTAIPAAPPAAAFNAPAPRPQRDVDRYLTRGLKALESGDINAARAFLERSVDLGSADAAVMLARTYDPATLQTTTVVAGVKADAAEARRWYQRAESLGATGVADALQRLSRP